MKKIAVVALGGNALLRGNEKGTIQEQETNTFNTCLSLTDLLRNDYNIVITHGNGPQVGNILLRNEAGYNTYKIPKMPIDICVADSQGGIGYMIERMFRNVLTEQKLKRNVVTVVTQVLVDKLDKAFDNPTKPVGAYYLKEEAELLATVNNWIFKEDPGKRGWRRVVASPAPLDILNKKIIKELVKRGHIVIAGGGGGIPVFLDDNKRLDAIEAVIDKDSAAALLAREIGADNFFILTDVPKVYINYKKPDQQALDVLTIAEAEKYIKENQFSKGSMEPKILAAIDFVRNTGHEAIITDASMLADSSQGTRIVK
ncbi:MAG: carbamate kinase [Bacteroidota bacterium]|nr:carbamate kinase [Bacteroidota bacterium]